jgi:hypothetical protein
MVELPVLGASHRHIAANRSCAYGVTNARHCGGCMHLVSQPKSGLEIAAAAAAHKAQHMETGMSVEFSAASAGQLRSAAISRSIASASARCG